MITIKNVENKLEKDGFVVSHISGNSMNPFLRENRDRVVISKINKDLSLYDVVLYKRENKYVLHRIVGITKDYYLIRGDNCVSLEKLNKNEIIGVLIAYYNSNEYIEITSKMNKKWYKKSSNTLFIRRILSKLRNK